MTRQLGAIAADAADDAAIAGIDPRFPLRAGTGADPMRRQRDSYRQLAAEIRQIDPRAVGDWPPHLLTDLAVDGNGRADLTPYTAPSGKQNLRDLLRQTAARSPRQPRPDTRSADRLAARRRIHRRIPRPPRPQRRRRLPAGRAEAESGVPGATWLATMALPLLRITGDGRSIAATLWHRTQQRNVTKSPLWHQPLDRPAVQALLEHPCLIPVDPAPTVRCTAWPALGSFTVTAQNDNRFPAGNSAAFSHHPGIRNRLTSHHGKGSTAS